MDPVDFNPPAHAPKGEDVAPLSNSPAGALAMDFDEVKRMAKFARDDTYYDKVYALQRWFAGDDTIMLEPMANTGGISAITGDEDLGSYPEIDVPLGQSGVNNYSLINARIDIQSVVYSEPEFQFVCDIPTLAHANSGYLKTLAREGNWGSIFLEAGMEVETAGISFVEIGLEDGGVVIRQRSVLDTLWDRSYRGIGEWRYIFFRNRLDIREAYKKYGHAMTREELEALSVPIDKSGVVKSITSSNGPSDMRQITEWSFWSDTHHCCILGGIANNGKVFNYAEDGSYQLQEGDNPEIGPNPFMTIPAAVWFDNWTPGVKRPVGKLESTWRVATMINALEAHVINNTERDISFTVLSTAGLTKQQIEEIQGSKGAKDIAKIILTDMPEANNVIAKTPTTGISPSVLQALSHYKQLLNPATGVMDAQRGQSATGEQSATEVRQLADAQGVQARHLRRQFASFLKMLTQKVRHIGALYDVKRRRFVMPNGAIYDSEKFPIAAFLGYPMDVYILEDSLDFKSEKDKNIERLQRLQAVDLPAIQHGVADPYKVFMDVYSAMSNADPTKVMLGPDEYMQKMQQQAQLQAAMQLQGLAERDQKMKQNGEKNGN